LELSLIVQISAPLSAYQDRGMMISFIYLIILFMPDAPSPRLHAGRRSYNNQISSLFNIIQ
jgi:hypothetical protein